MSDVAKPCGELGLDDFREHAVWIFDHAGEPTPGRDETWVRPFTENRFDDLAQPAFFLAEIGNDGGLVPALAIASRPVEWRTHAFGPIPRLTDLVLLAPYAAISIVDDADLDASSDSTPDVGFSLRRYQPERVAALLSPDAAMHRGTITSGRSVEERTGKVSVGDVQELIRRGHTLPLQYRAVLRLGVLRFVFEGAIG